MPTAVTAERPAFKSRRVSRIATRAKILFFVIPALAVGITLLLGRSVSMSIADDSSRRLAQQYSIEAAANFQIGINEHFVLMQQIARSTTISRWLGDEGNPISKSMAFDEIMGYAVFAPNVYLMFTVYESLHGYYFPTDLVLENFEPWVTLVYGSAASQWFFDTRDAEKPFILNIQRTHPRDGHWEHYIWSNHRMYYQGRLVGVVTAGSNFDDIFDAVFGNFDVGTKRGYIIDRVGNVRADSAGLLVVDYEGIPVFATPPEAAESLILTDSINEHLQVLDDDIFFRPGTHNFTAVALEAGGVYRYAGISPIIGTDWSVLVLSNSFGYVFEGLYTPMIMSSIAVLGIMALIGFVLMRSLILVPLSKLTESTKVVSAADSGTEIFGLNRDDEIGYLAHTISEAQNSLRYHDKLLGTLTQAAEILLTTRDDSPLEGLNAGMELLGRFLNVDRVQIWHHEKVGGEMEFVLRHYWLSDVGKRKRVIPIGFKYPFNSNSEWVERLLLGAKTNGPISELPLSVEPIVRKSEAVSIATLPMFLNDKVLGFFSVHDCQRERTFTNEEMDILASAGLMFTSVFTQNVQRDLANRDELTGIWNRRYFMVTADQDLQNCLAEDLDYSLIMMDIDNFKKVNDTYGHLFGDGVLKVLAARVGHVLKEDTVFARYGGEEFVVVLPGVSHEAAIKTAWRIQKNVTDSAFRFKEMEVNVTVSFGVASKTANCTDMFEIINNADKALYNAKKAGKNTVVGFNEENFPGI